MTLSARGLRQRAAALGLPLAPLGPEEGVLKAQPRAAAVISGEAARGFGVVPIELRDDALLVASADPDPGALSSLAALIGMPVRAALAEPEDVARTQVHLYGPPRRNRPAPSRASPPQVASGDERDRYREVARRFELPFVALEPGHDGPDPVDASAARRMGEHACRGLGVLPITSSGAGLALATSDPAAVSRIEAAGVIAGTRAWSVISPPSELAAATDRVFAAQREEPAPTPPAFEAPGESEAEALARALLAAGTITATDLDEANELHRRYGGRLGDVISHAGLAPERDVAATLARLRRITFTDPGSLHPDPAIIDAIPEDAARRLGVVPMTLDDETLFLATSEPLSEAQLDELRRLAGTEVRPIAAPATSVEAMLGSAYAERWAETAANSLHRSRPEDSATRVLSRPQKIALAVLALIGLAALLVSPLGALIAFNVVAITIYVAVILYRFRLVSHSLGHEMELPVSEEELAALDERKLPMYTILVPLYREPQMLPHIVRSIAEIDYPATRLDVKIILESDDAETLAALEDLHLPPHFRLVVVPDSEPKTKPKACNFGLLSARGRYVVIYDAEDEPEPDQLKKSVVAFSKADPAVVCMQCKLNYYNQDQNLLTRWFTTEYSLWFDLLLPGLDASDAPIPLGGTSNHFITERLLEVGAWDPYNVTEDADLGIRLHKRGHRTGVIDSTTYEEANSEVVNWIRQRSRWVKGYMQTWLVQMRHPLRLRRELGWRGWLSFQLTVGGTPAIFLLNPIYWLLTVAWLLTEASVIKSAFPSLLFYVGGIGFYAGNFLLAYMAAAAASKRGYHDLVKYAMLVPLYWVLMSIGAWKGLIQLLYKPSYWEKTEHGLHLDDPEGERLASAQEAAR